MGKYANLNEIVGYYKIWRNDSEKELKELKKRLSNVPVILEGFEEQLGIGGFGDLDTRAEFYNPQTRIMLLDDLVSPDKADEITERMVIPYPIIYINGEGSSHNFHKNHRDNFRLIVSDGRDKTARVFHNPYSRVSGSLAIIYKQKKTKTKRNIHYIEMILTNDKL